MEATVDVHRAVQEYWNTDNILIMGDLNADGGYASKKAMKKLGLRKPPFHWLIGDDVDTTTTRTDCAYDRQVVRK